MPYKNKSDRNFKREYRVSQSSPQDIADRAARNKARRVLEKEGKVHKGDGMDVDHVMAIDKGGSKNARSNLRVKTASDNRSFKRKSDGSVK